MNSMRRIVAAWLTAAVASALPGVGSAQISNPQMPQQTEPDGVVVALEDLVLVALQRNLDLQTRRAQARIAETGVQSAESVFGWSLGDKMADRILDELREVPNGLTTSQISVGLFRRNKSAGDIRKALGLLQKHQLAYATEEATEGRPAERWRAGTPTK